MRKSLSTPLILALCAILLYTAIGFGAFTSVSSEAEPEITVLLNGEKIEFDVPPIVENARTLVPLRGIFEALGMEVTYENDEIAAQKEGLIINLTVGSSSAYVNGEQRELDVASRVISDRTIVPLRFIGEATGLIVNYDSATSIVTMDDPVKSLSPKNHDLKSDWDETASIINLNGDSATVEGSGVSVNGGVITISAAGTYVVGGSLTNGQIIVDASKDDRIHLILNGADITNKTGAGIYAPQCDKLILTLAEGTNNTITDGGGDYTYTLVAEQEPNAAVFVKDDLTINGTGALTVNAGFNNGIGTKDDLLIINGKLTVTAVNNGLRGNDSVGIVDGVFNISTDSDGIQTNNGDDTDKGWIIIEGGTFDIKTKNDGIQAENDMTITGGKFNITTGGGSVNAPEPAEGFGRGGQFPAERQAPADGQTPTNRAIPAEQLQTTAPAEETESIKALKAVKRITITDGDFTIDAVDDGIHSNNNILITSGKFHIQTGDDGIHADNIVNITGGDINIPKCYEGIEGLAVIISGGNISVIASDDAINASKEGGGNAFGGGRMQPQNGQQGMMPGGMDGMDVEAMQKVMEIIREAGINPLTDEQIKQLHDLGFTDEQIEQFRSITQGGMGRRGGIGGQPSMQGGQQGMQGNGMNEPRFNATEGAYVRISGGSIELWGRTDGIDSNGNIYLEGGTVKISGQSSGAEGALEMDGDFILTGGELITAGSVYTPSTGSTQPIILLSYTSQQASGSIITLKASDGSKLLEYTSQTAFTASGFTSPSFKMGETYSVFINGEKRVDITLSDLTTSIGDDGGAYSAGRGMGGGRNGRFGGMEPFVQE